jgi:hypothetical protein
MEVISDRQARGQRTVILPDPSNYHPFHRSPTMVGRCNLCALRWDSHWHTLWTPTPGTRSMADTKRLLGIA